MMPPCVYENEIFIITMGRRLAPVILATASIADLHASVRIDAQTYHAAMSVVDIERDTRDGMHLLPLVRHLPEPDIIHNDLFRAHSSRGFEVQQNRRQ